MLEGRPFTILTDHKPLESAFKTMTERSPIQKRYLSFISQFSTNIKHIAGRENVVADALSRPDCDSVEPDPNLLQNIVEAQKEDVELRGLVEVSSGPFVLDRIRFPDFLVVCETSTKVGRHTRTVPESIPMPKNRFSHVHMDIVGPLSCSSGYRYLLTTVDRCSRGFSNGRYDHGDDFRDVCPRVCAAIWCA